MNNIAIITDSSADIPQELAKENELMVIPMYVGFEGNLYKEGKEITTKEVFEALEKGLKVHTSGPSSGDFVEVFKYLIEEKKKDIIYYIGLSSRLSSTINSAAVAKRYFPDSKIKIFDSKNSTISLGFIALEAARAAKKNAGEKEIDALISYLTHRSKFFATLENFEYVFKGGRAPFLGKFLSKAIILKPIVTINKSGKVQLKKFVRSKKNAISELYKQIKKETSYIGKKKIGIFYGLDIKPANELEKMIREDSSIDIDELILTEITTIISAHTGPAIWGVATCPKVEDYKKLISE